MASFRYNDVDLIREKLTAWHSERLGRTVELSELVVPATGVVNDTFVYTCRWQEEGRPRERGFVMRAQPKGFSNLQHNDVLRQAHVLMILGTATELPVAKVVEIEHDDRYLGRPFFVMERVPGAVAEDDPPYPREGWLKQATPEIREHVYRSGLKAIADVHRVSWQEIGLADLDRRVSGESALHHQVRTFIEFFRWGAQGKTYALLTEAEAWLWANFPAREGPTVLNWNDGRLGNMMFDHGELRALLDWELVTIGPPEIDVVWFLWHDQFMSECLVTTEEGRPGPRLTGSPSLLEGSGWYEEFTGYEPRDLSWYEVWCAFRMAVYMMRQGKGMIEAGLAEPDSGVDEVNICSLHLADLLGSRDNLR